MNRPLFYLMINLSSNKPNNVGQFFFDRHAFFNQHVKEVQLVVTNLDLYVNTKKSYILDDVF